MSENYNGGPAFPTVAHFDCEHIANDPGMTLRDYFAAKALPAVLAQKDVHKHTSEWQNAAWIAYQIADAMIEARK